MFAHWTRPSFPDILASAVNAVLTFSRAQKEQETRTPKVSLVCAPKIFGVPLHIYIFFFFFESSYHCVLFLDTLVLPDNFEGTGGAVFTSFQTRQYIGRWQ